MTAALAARRVAQLCLALIVASLPFAKTDIGLLGPRAVLTDVLFLLCAALAGLALLLDRRWLRSERSFLFIGLYLAALAVSLTVSPDLRKSAFKLTTQVYLVLLPALVLQLVDDERQLRTLLLAWLAATAVPAALGTMTVVAFYSGVDRSLLDGPLHPFGSLPPGYFPRLETTFRMPAMMCNYLAVSIVVLAFAWKAGWVGRSAAVVLAITVIVAALFTLTPGLGGFFLSLAIAIAVARGHPVTGKQFLARAVVTATAIVIVSSATPILHPTATYLIDVPLLGLQLAPAVRMMTWTAAAQVFVAHPLVGAGLDTTSIAVLYLDPSGGGHRLTDAHNLYLNIAAQCGVVGLAALLALILHVARRTFAKRSDGAWSLPVVLGIAWLGSFAVQGVAGSFEDARHLWVLLGLWLASTRLERESRRNSTP